MKKIYYILCAVPTIAAVCVILAERPFHEGTVLFFLIDRLCPSLIRWVPPVITGLGVALAFRGREALSPLLAAAFVAAWPFLAWNAAEACAKGPSNPPYLIEVRENSPDGAVVYLPQSYAGWDHEGTIDGLRHHTKDLIYQSVYADGLEYCFSRSGHVYAVAGAEENGRSRLVREWIWSGSPHDFPFYEFSRACNYCRK